ncbi:MAG: molybdopterin molybdotransferase MoeA [Synergistaceae bacterium]|jgi:molybdopterin molybdotransferase/putative molybdopterin biosynthesis protein|nr:molybdopterin molybdotransferase MoeA [Synergistaceae bacterium]
MKKKLIIVPPKKCARCRSCVNNCDKSKSIPLNEAMARLFSVATFHASVEDAHLESALGRITAARHISKWDVPNRNVATKDGVAVNYERIFSSDSPFSPFETEDFEIVPMGSPVSDQYDTLLHAEQCSLTEGGIQVIEKPTRGQCVTWKGHSLEKGELIVDSHVRLRPGHLFMLRMGGVEIVKVIRKPRVAVIPIGDDIIQPGAPLAPGEMVEADGLYVKSLAEEYGGEAALLPPVGDDVERIQSALRDAARSYDLIAIIGGLGKGRSAYRDYTVTAVEGLGDVINHGVLVSPGGSPSLVAVIDGKPVLGIPGPPHAALIMADVLLKPVLNRYYKTDGFSRPKVWAELMSDFQPRGDTEWHVRIHLKRNGQGYEVYPVAEMGDTVENIAASNGVVKIPPRKAFARGERIEVEILSEIIGGH